MLSPKYFIALVFMTCAISITHRTYLSYLFEQEYYFSHLSEVEREISFKSEAGFYYSFYKTLVTNDLISGVDKLINDNTTEYPDTINTLQRFNLYPELMAALSYKSSMFIFSVFDLPTKKCYKVNRGQGRGAVVSCEGIGEPVFVYLEIIFTLNGIMMGLIFLSGCYLSNSILGGIISVLSFFYNHGECTRVYLTPPLRESFGYPFWVLHSLLTTFILGKDHCNRNVVIPVIGLSTFLFLLPWQFSQFVLAIQTSIIFVIYVVTNLEAGKTKSIFYGNLIGLMVAIIFQFANSMLMCSYFMCTCLVSLIVISFRETYNPKRGLFTNFVSISIFIAMVVISKMVLSFVFNVEDDSHILDILRSKFSSFKSFHAMLYTCAPEFDFIDVQTFYEVSKTLLLPLTVFSTLRIVIDLFFNFRNGKNEDNVLPLYMTMHLLVFVVMATSIMRLKLFLVPHMCLVASHVATMLPIKNTSIKMSFLVMVIGIMSYKGLQNINLQSSITGEFNDDATENLVSWISRHTDQNSVFAGPMATMATVKLATGRVIINHPHYENALLRLRTKEAYKVFSRKPLREVWQSLLDLKLDFFILEETWCWGRSKSNCSLADIWDYEDSVNRGNPRSCSLLYSNPKPYFQQVYKNNQHTILKIVKNIEN